MFVGDMRYLFIITTFLVTIYAFQNCSDFKATGGAGGFPSETPVEERLVRDQSGAQVVELGQPLDLQVDINPKLFVNGSLQWQFQGLGEAGYADLNNETSANLTIESFGFNDQGLYKLVIRTGQDVSESLPISVQVRGQNNTCDAADLDMAWPLQGPRNQTWFINFFKDVNRQPNQLEDFSGDQNQLAQTYDQHRGIDISLQNFSVMDQNIPIFAAQGGVVQVLDDGHPDRQTMRGDRPANYIVIRHANGYSTGYFHLKANSITHAVGDVVAKGEQIGLVGSSGDSADPHLHFETRNCAGLSVDHMLEELLTSPVAKQRTPAFIGTFLRLNTPFQNREDVLQTSGTSITSAQSGQTVYYTNTYSNIESGDVMTERFYNPAGGLAFENSLTASANLGIAGRYDTWSSFFLNTRGNWTIRYFVNDQEVHSLTFRIP